MVLNENGNTPSDEISLFDIADWFWSFRWLAIGLSVFASIWTGVLFWTGHQNVPTTTSYVVTTTIYPSGTPVRTAAEIAAILKSRLEVFDLSVTSARDTNLVTVNVLTNDAAQAAIAAAQQLEEELGADVQAQVNLLAPLMRNENVPDSIASQYVKNVAFLEGQTGLFRLIDPVVRQDVSGTTGQSRFQLLIPWLLCGMAFLAIAGGVSFSSAWKAHRARKFDLTGQGG